VCVSVNAAAAGVRAVRAGSSTYDDGLCARARFALHRRLRRRLLRPRRRPRRRRKTDVVEFEAYTTSDIISWSANARSDGPRENDNITITVITLYIFYTIILLPDTRGGGESDGRDGFGDLHCGEAEKVNTVGGTHTTRILYRRRRRRRFTERNANHQITLARVRRIIRV